MSRLNSLTGLFALVALGSMPAASLPPAVVLVSARAVQEPDPESEGAEAGKQALAALRPAATLSADDRETLELLHLVLADEGREAARELLREIVQALAEPEPGEEKARITFLLELDRSADELGSLEESLVLCGSILDLQTRLLPPDHRDLLEGKQHLAVARQALGDIHGAHELFETLLEARTRLLPPDHPDLLSAKLDLATTRKQLGDLAGAHELEEAVLEARTRLLASDDPDLLSAKQSLAVTRYALGDLAGAHELFEAVLEARTRLLPPDHPDLLGAKLNLAVTRKELGDLDGARGLEEAVLEARTRLLPPDHPDLLGAKQNLAVTRKELGDLDGARELEETVLEARTQLLPSDHPDLLDAKQNLATTRYELGDLEGAREIEEAVLEARTRLLPPDHPALLDTKQILALTRKELGDLEGARALEETVLEARTRLLPPDHPALLDAKQNLAATRYGLGDLDGARELFDAVLEVRTQLLPRNHPDLLDAKQNLATTKAELGDLAGARELVSSLLAGMQQRAGALRSEAARPAREGARAEIQRLSFALFLCASVDPERTLLRDLFGTLESLRLASVASAEAAQALAGRPELAQQARGIAALRSELNDLVATGPREGTADEWRQSLLELAEQRDRAERRLRANLAEAGAFVGEIDAGALGSRLAPETAAVSFLRYAKAFEQDPETKETPPDVDSLLAFVVQPGGAVTRVELGPTAELSDRVGAWRAALGRPLAGRGISGSDEVRGEEALGRLGAELRARILDPILAVTGEVRALHVVLDDVLFLVPLDTLPHRDGLVGERIAIRNEVTLAQLLSKPSPIPAGGRLVLAGGLDYDAELGGEAVARLDAATPPVGDSLERSETSRTSFAFLPGTTAELESIAALYEGTFEGEATTLTGAGGTKGALVAHAPGARWLHLATHGWFASESFKSQLDASAEGSARDAFQRAETALTGFAPETLCGLALAGANRGRDALGRVPGILTAEELASFDLRNCELAVLSACETNVGIRRAGQGIQSLQTALHAAGARTAITSLWKVDDAATRRLFELFYTKLWKDKLGKHDALWQAKMALRAEGHRPRDWAGWILSGDPE